MIPDDVQQLFDRLLGEGLEFDPEIGPLVAPEQALELASGLKELGFVFLVYCSSAHFPAAGEEDEETCLTTYRVRRLGQTRASVAFHLRVPYGQPTPSMVPVWVGADWQEREQYDLVGARFEGHPDLRRIMMPEDWKGHPLRRDYPIDTPHFPWR